MYANSAINDLPAADKPVLTKKQLQSLRTREILLKTAVSCFANFGYSGCSMDTIAQAAGLTKGAIYTHFSSKNDLFIAIIHYAYKQAISLAVELKGRLSVREAIVLLLVECVRNPEFPIDHKLWAGIVSVANREEKVRDAFMGCQLDFRKIIKQWIQEGINDGEITSDVNIETVTSLIFALGNGLVILLKGSDDFQDENLSMNLATIVNSILAS